MIYLIRVELFYFEWCIYNWMIKYVINDDIHDIIKISFFIITSYFKFG